MVDISLEKQTIKKKQRFSGLKDILFRRFLLVVTIISASFIIWIILFISMQGVLPFITDNNGLGRVGVWNFLTETVWLRGETFVSTAYGAGFIIINTLYVVSLSLLISMPIGVLTALFIAKIAPSALANILRTVTELMAAIPSIVYGLIGVGVFLPLIYRFAEMLGMQSRGGNSTLAVVIVLAFMSLPTITAISELSIRSVDKHLEEAALALGASETQTHFKVVLVAAKSGIFTGGILAIGRALGEATAVSLVAGNSRSGPNFGLFDITSTITSTMLQGLKETTGIDYDIRYSLGILLLVIILIMNAIMHMVKKRMGVMGNE